MVYHTVLETPTSSRAAARTVAYAVLVPLIIICPLGRRYVCEAMVFVVPPPDAGKFWRVRVYGHAQPDEAVNELLLRMVHA